MPILIGILAFIGLVVLAYVMYQGVLRIDEEFVKIRKYYRDKKDEQKAE